MKKNRIRGMNIHKDVLLAELHKKLEIGQQALERTDDPIARDIYALGLEELQAVLEELESKPEDIFWVSFE